MAIEKEGALKLDRDTLPWIIVSEVVDNCEMVRGDEPKKKGEARPHYVTLVNSSSTTLKLMKKIRKMIDEIVDMEVNRKLIDKQKETKEHEDKKDFRAKDPAKVDG